MKSFRVTLTLANTNYNLYTLIAAIMPTFYDQGRQVMIQSDTANSDAVLIGDSNLSATVYGINLAAALASVNLGSAPLMVRLHDYYARSATAGQILEITVIY